MNERTGDWICTQSGVAFYPLDPRIEDVRLDDIAHALANKCRFTGHTRVFYSVAEHCVRGVRIGQRLGYSDNVLRAFLLHDGSEAYLPDVARPIKASLTGFMEIEARVQAAVYAAFGIEVSEAEAELVRKLDDIMLATERRDLMPPITSSWVLAEAPSAHEDVRDPWDADVAKRVFLGVSGLLGITAKTP